MIAGFAMQIPAILRRLHDKGYLEKEIWIGCQVVWNKIKNRYEIRE